MLLANGSFRARHAAGLTHAVARTQQERARNAYTRMGNTNRITNRTRLVASLTLSLSSLEDNGTRVARSGRFARDMAKAKFLALDARLAARLTLAGPSLDKGGALGHRGDSLPQGGEFIELLSLEKLGIDGVDEFGNVSNGGSGHGSLVSLVSV